MASAQEYSRLLDSSDHQLSLQGKLTALVHDNKNISVGYSLSDVVLHQSWLDL